MRTFTRREARLRMLAENSPDVYFSLRFPEVRYEYISPSIEALCGYSPEQFYRDSGTLMRCLPPEWQATVSGWLKEIAQGKVADAYEFQIIDRTGGLRWLRQRQIFCPTPDGSAWLLQGSATDITELRQAQRQLRDSEAHFRQLIELWPDQVMLSVNLDAGRHEYVSPTMERVMGYAPQEFYDDPGLGMRMVAPRWREQVGAWLEEIRVGVLQPSYEFELVHKSGEHRWVQQIGMLRPRAPGQGLVVQFTFRDITEKKWAETALLESEARFRQMAESWTDQVLVRINLATGRHEYVSPGMTRIFGYRPEEFYMESSRALDAVLPEWRPLLRQWQEENRRGILRSEYEFEVVDAWGNRRWVLQRGSLLHGEGGRPTVLQAVLCDNTERRRLEDALRESNQRYALLSDNLVDVIWALDVGLSWTYMSPSSVALTGYGLDDLAGRRLDELLTPESWRASVRVLEDWGRAAPGSPEDGPVCLALDLRHADGGLVPVEVLARPVRDAEGRITGYCGTARDIRPRRRMERVEASLSRLSRVLLECEDMAQTQMLAAACAEEITGAREVLAAPHDPESGLGRADQPQPECWPEGSLCVPVLHAGEVLGSLAALGVPDEARPEAGFLLERVASLLALAMARIRAEEALRRSERMSRKLLESMHEAVWAVDRDEKTIFVNERLAALLGYSVDELSRMRLYDVVDEEQARLGRERMRERRMGIPGSSDYELIRKDGTRLPVHVTASPILDESGGYEGLVCTGMDLSERKRMEGELRRNQARFEALYELSRQGMRTEAQMAAFTLREGLRLTGSTAGVLFFVSADGGQLNPMAWHGTPEHLRSGPFPAHAETPWGVVLATQAPLLLNDFSIFRDELPAGHIEMDRFLGVPAMDSERPRAILGLTGKATGYTSDDSLQVSLLMDGMWRIVRSRRDEERIRSSLREKEALLREVHHRVKNNLQVVSSLLDMAGRRVTGDEARQSLEEVRAKVQAMSLVHAQLHSGGPDGAGSARGIDLERYVRSLFRQLREVYSGDMTLSATVSLGGLMLGLDQAVPLGLALNEALTNVFKHARRDDRPGQVDIRATLGAEGRVCIEVRDDGPGLPEGLDPERTRSLGMKLMFGLVRHQLGGELGLANAPEGVLVRICFQPHVAD
ncbi:MAG: PAS domain S-box protein [Desulfovibrio sp.]